MTIREGLVVVIVGGVLTSLSSIVVLGRLWTRYVYVGAVNAADYTMLVALVLTWANFVVNYYMDIISNGSRPEDFIDPSRRGALETTLRGILVTWWVYRLSYNVALSFVKLSILFFYRSLAAGRVFRWLVNGTIGLVSIYTIAAAIAAIFQCQHPADAFDTSSYIYQFDKSVVVKEMVCYNPITTFIASTTMNLLTDIITLLLPIPTFWSLHAPLAKRIGLCGIFSLGIIAIVASAVRMHVVILWAQSPWNSAIYGSKLLLWGQVETNVGIISASIPFFRILCRRRSRAEQRAISMGRVQQFSPRKPSDRSRDPELGTQTLIELEQEKVLSSTATTPTRETTEITRPSETMLRTTSTRDPTFASTMLSTTSSSEASAFHRANAPHNALNSYNADHSRLAPQREPHLTI